MPFPLTTATTTRVTAAAPRPTTLVGGLPNALGPIQTGVTNTAMPLVSTESRGTTGKMITGL